MGRSHCCSKERLNRGAWTAKEDMILSAYIQIHGDGGWRNLPKRAGLNRCGKSCRLRWVHYLHPDIKHGNISPDEEELIIRMHRLLGNRWSLIAGRLPGRTDNEIKNYWNTHLKKKVYLMDKCQDKMPANLKTRAESRPPLQNGVLFKTTPIKITTAVRHYEMVSSTNVGGSEHAIQMCNIEETTNCSKSCCDIFVNDSIPEDDSKLMAFHMADVNLIETKADQQYSLAGNAATLIDELLCESNNLSSDPDCNQSVFSTGFGLEDFYSELATLDEETNEFEFQSNMQRVNSITVPSDQRMEEFYDSTEPVDWNHVLNYILN